MTVDIEKLKALALAATRGPWMRLFGERTVYDRMEDGCRGNAIVRAGLGYSRQDTDNLNFIAGANPAAVLELIAEVERLRAELATRCRAEGGDTSADGSVINYGSPVDKCAAPAAGTVEKDALTALDELADEAHSNGNSWEDSAWLPETVKKIRAAIEAHSKAGKEQ